MAGRPRKDADTSTELDERVDLAPQTEADPPNDEGVDELTTGVPRPADVPEGSTQFAAFEAYEAQAAEETRLRANRRSIVDLDTGTTQSGDLPITRVNELAREAVAKDMTGMETCYAERSGKTLTVSASTKHGTSRAQADVKDWSEGGVKAALEDIGAQMRGEKQPPSQTPEQKLAEAVKALSQGGA